VVEEGELKLLNFRLVLLKKDDVDANGEATSDCSGLSLKSTAYTHTQNLALSHNTTNIFDRF
jgi:hypothetical protein